MNFECENCGFEPKSVTCSACRERAPAWVKYCPLCGAVMKAELAAETGGDPFAMENRRLCPDGTCIGILGADNRCIVCGKEG